MGDIHSDVQFWQIAHPLMQKALDEIGATISPSSTSPVSKVLNRLLNRIVDSVHVLLTLGLNHRGPYEHDACSILRSAYDVFIQAAHIVADPKKADERARDYLDFLHIERHQFQERIERSTVAMKARVLSSPLRAQNEPQIQADFERVKRRFATQDGKFRKNWYRGDLRSLAVETGHSDEYDLVLASLHSSVHSSAFALIRGPSVRPDYAAFFAMRLVFRLVGLLAKHHGVTFSDPEVNEAVGSFAENLFDMPPT